MPTAAARWTLPLVAALLGAVAGFAGSLHAEEGASERSPAQTCRTFSLTVDDGQGGLFVTSDRTGPVGEWVGTLEDQGWHLASMDYEAVQKATGFPEHRVLVCVAR